MDDYKNEFWNCSNKEYLDVFLAKNYANADWSKIDQVEVISDQCKQIFLSGCKRSIYCYCKCQNTPELFTSDSWRLHKYTNKHQVKEFGSFFLFFDNYFDRNWLKCITFLDDYILIISNIMNVMTLPKISIYILGADVMNKLFASDSISGFYDPLKDKIYLDDLDKNATHEITHSIMNKWGICTNLFCNEGIAECFKRPIVVPKEYICSIKSFADIFFDWNDLCNEKYGVGGLFFRYIFLEYGIDTIKDICSDAQHDADSKKMEDITKSITKDSNIEKNFVDWFRDINIEKEDWYFRYKKTNGIK